MKSIDKNFMKELVHQFDLMNTVNGGASLTSVEVLNLENKTELKISAPGVSPEAFNIYINNNQLMVFSIIPQNSESRLPLSVPLFSRTWTIPVYVDEEKIEALQEGNSLKIILPFKNNSKPNLRKIDIRSIY